MKFREFIGLMVLLSNGFVQFLIVLFIISLFIPFEWLKNVIYFIIAVGIIVGLIVLFVNTFLRW